MKVKQFFESLSYGDLSNTYIGGSGSGIIPENSVNKLINLTNMGLNDMYSRLRLLEKDCYIQMISYIGNYVLDKKHAVSNKESTEIKYIVDSIYEPFDNDVIRIHKVVNEANQDLGFNDDGLHCSIKVSGHNSIQITNPVEGNVVQVTYMAKGKELISMDDEINIPSYLIEALGHYVAGKALSSMNNQLLIEQSNLLLSKYEIAVNKAVSNNLNREFDTRTNTKLEDRGFI